MFVSNDSAENKVGQGFFFKKMSLSVYKHFILILAFVCGFASLEVTIFPMET